jgi:anti-sigma-K factor RskA
MVAYYHYNNVVVMIWKKVKAIAPLYVIGALDEKTAQEVEASLDSATPQQHHTIARWRDVATLLPQALPLQTPPDYVRERLISRIAEESQQTPIEIAVEESTSREMAEQGEIKILPFVKSRRAESNTVRWMLIAASVLLAIGFGYLFKRNADLAHKLDALAKERDRLLRVVAEGGRQGDNTVTPRNRVIELVGEEIPQANATVVWDTKAQQWAICIFDLPAPPSDKDYQLWYVTKNSSKISAAVFRTDSKGRTILKLTLPPDASAGLAATAVTLEPRGGSPQPTGKFYLKASI